jgi:hypothetical protein
MLHTGAVSMRVAVAAEFEFDGHEDRCKLFVAGEIRKKYPF